MLHVLAGKQKHIWQSLGDLQGSLQALQCQAFAGGGLEFSSVRWKSTAKAAASGSKVKTAHKKVGASKLACHHTAQPMCFTTIGLCKLI